MRKRTLLTTAVLSLLLPSASAYQNSKSEGSRPKEAKEAKKPALTSEDVEILKDKELLQNLELLRNLEMIQYLDFLSHKSTAGEKEAPADGKPVKKDARKKKTN